MSHVVLLGDSVFDNGVYVEPGEPDVAQQLRQTLSDDSEVTLLAVDGDCTYDVPEQLNDLPASATHLVLSIGGNDALGYLNVLDQFDQPVSTVREAVRRLGDIRDQFEEQYRAMLSQVNDQGLPLALFTIYSGNFRDSELQAAVDTILPVINDVILEAAFDSGVPVIQLDRVCNEAVDYANPIEPSTHGGEKIARTIRRVLETHDFSDERTTIYDGP